jgi:hypothetical protein
VLCGATGLLGLAEVIGRRMIFFLASVTAVCHHSLLSLRSSKLCGATGLLDLVEVIGRRMKAEES